MDTNTHKTHRGGEYQKPCNGLAVSALLNASPLDYISSSFRAKKFEFYAAAVE